MKKNKKKKKKYYLIDNFWHVCLEFNTLKELKEKAEEMGWTAKRCYFTDNWYWLDNAC